MRTAEVVIHWETDWDKAVNSSQQTTCEGTAVLNYLPFYLLMVFRHFHANTNTRFDFCSTSNPLALGDPSLPTLTSTGLDQSTVKISTTKCRTAGQSVERNLRTEHDQDSWDIHPFGTSLLKPQPGHPRVNWTYPTLLGLMGRAWADDELPISCNESFR